MSASEVFTPQERMATFTLASIMASRLLGLFMLLPVISLFVSQIPGASASSVGLCIGIYGLTQAICQLPMGYLSDRIGRTPVILFGLSIFVLGSLAAAFFHHIYALIFARALQGSGAVGATILAYLGDTTRDVVRTKAFAIVGITIGIAFSLALIIGPILSSLGGLDALFLTTAGLGLLAMGQVYYMHKRFPVARSKQERPPLKKLITCPNLRYLSISIGLLHVLLTFLFMSLPITLTSVFHMDSMIHWKVYLPVFIGALILLGPMLKRLNQLEKTIKLFQGMVLLLGVSLIFLLSSSLPFSFYIVSMIVFFTMFNGLEAALPSLVSRLVNPHYRGSAMGVYSTAQFLGIFIGGSVGGMLNQFWGTLGLQVGALIGVALWCAAIQVWSTHQNSRGGDKKWQEV